MSDQVTITVKDWDDDFNAHLSDFIEELQALLASIPEQYRENASIDFDRRGDDYDYPRGELTVQYSRPKTADELRRERECAAANLRDNEAQERRQYEALKAKFGNKQ